MSIKVVKFYGNANAKFRNDANSPSCVLKQNYFRFYSTNCFNFLPSDESGLISFKDEKEVTYAWDIVPEHGILNFCAHKTFDVEENPPMYAY